MGMLIEAPLYVAPLPIWQSWNCGGPVHLDIKSKHAEDVGLCVLYQGPHITCINHTHRSWIVWNCVVEVLHQAGVKTCMSHTESPVKGWISHGTPLLSETGQFTRFSTTCWISHIFAILPLFYPRRPWHLLACRFHTTCDKSFSDFTQILFRSIFQLCNNRLPTKVWLVLSWPTSTYSQHTMQIDFSTFKHFKMPKNYLIRVSSKQMRVSRKAIFHHFHIACSFRFFSITTIEWWTVFRGQTHYSPLQQFWRNRPKVNWQQLSNCFLGREKGFPRSYMGNLRYDQTIIRKIRFKDSRTTGWCQRGL